MKKLLTCFALTMILASVTAAVAQQHKAVTAPSSAPVVPKNIPPSHGIVHTAYSLRYVDTKIGTGPLAPAGKFYTVHYTGWLKDGTKFDSSLDRGEPITFQQGAHKVIPGWDTGFEGMHIGGKRRLFIPYQLAYGDRGAPPDIPEKSNLIFDVELISVADTRAPIVPAPGAAQSPRPSAAPKSNPAQESKPSTATGTP